METKNGVLIIFKYHNPFTFHMSYIADSLLEHLEITQKDGEWAYWANKLTRQVHLHLWRCRPDKAYVEGTVMPALEKAHDIVMDLPKTGEHGEDIEHYAHCIAMRMISGYKYLRDEKPYAPVTPSTDLPWTEESGSLDACVADNA